MDPWIEPSPAGGERLAARTAASAAQGRRHLTLRRADMLLAVATGGARIRTVLDSGAARRLRLVELPPGAALRLPLRAASQASAWLLNGQAHVAWRLYEPLQPHIAPAGDTRLHLASREGARLLVREAWPDAAATAAACRAGPWEALAEGISRRLIGPAPCGQGAFLVRLAAGTCVPAHRHHHDEECLLLEGEMYLDDQLLMPGDFQLAGAGGVHRSAGTDRGALLYVHGDLELDCIANSPC